MLSLHSSVYLLSFVQVCSQGAAMRSLSYLSPTRMPGKTSSEILRTRPELPITWAGDPAALQLIQHRQLYLINLVSSMIH
jgi:hypothetical protein